jgi:hypothetical protein
MIVDLESILSFSVIKALKTVTKLKQESKILLYIVPDSPKDERLIFLNYTR